MDKNYQKDFLERYAVRYDAIEQLKKTAEKGLDGWCVDVFGGDVERFRDYATVMSLMSEDMIRGFARNVGVTMVKIGCMDHATVIGCLSDNEKDPRGTLLKLSRARKEGPEVVSATMIVLI